jgi:hypothetical protein
LSSYCPPLATLMLAKVGLEVVAISCGVEKVKVLPAGVIIIWLAVPAKVMSPFKLLMCDTPPDPPPPLVKQVGQVRLPAASRLSGPLALTATVPLALGIVTVWLATAGPANTRVLVNEPLLALSEVLPSPWRVKVWVGVPTVRVAVGVIVLTA